MRRRRKPRRRKHSLSPRRITSSRERHRSSLQRPRELGMLLKDRGKHAAAAEYLAMVIAAERPQQK